MLLIDAPGNSSDSLVHTKASGYASTMWRIFLQQNQKLGAFQARFNAQSAWALRWAVTAGLLVVVLPAIVLVLVAMLIGLCVFFILSAVARIGAMFGMGGNENRPMPDDIGLRENVRVIKEE